MNKKTSFRSLLVNKNYILLLSGLFVSRIGSFMQIVAIHWHLYQLTGSAISLGFLGIATFFPVLFSSFFSGISADAFNRKKIIFVVQLFSIINALMLFYVTETGNVNPTLIYILVGIDSFFYSFESPARQSMTSNIVKKKDFGMAVSINNLSYHTANFIGPALSGFVIAYLGISSVYLINAFTFIIVILALVFMDPLIKNYNHPDFSVKNIFRGFNFVFKSPLIYGSMLIDFLATFFASATTLLPIFAVEILKIGPEQMGLLYAAPSVGAILAGSAFTFFSRTREKGKILIKAVIIFGAATFLFGLSRNYYLSLFLIALTGAADMISVIIRNIIRQMSTPDKLRGRMSAVSMIFYTGGPQLGEIEAGFTGHLFGVPQSVAIGGLATIVCAFIVSKKIPQLTDYRDKKN